MEMKLNDCFPTKWSAIVFALYMCLFINQGILVTASKGKDSKFGYSTVTVVMFIECIKLVASTLIYLQHVQFKFMKLIQDIIANSKVLLLYFVPAVLYSVYNNLTFINLSVFDPTTYYLLMQFRVVVTGIVFQVLFKKKLSKKQWLSLVLLTLGCVIKQLHVSNHSSEAKEGDSKVVDFRVNFYLFLVLVQVFCSCFAGVYNEYLLKDVGADAHLMLQNIFMYIDCIICNFIVLLLNGEAQTAFSSDAISSVFRPLVLAIMFNGAACGIITSVFLKNLNSIMKTFASAIELMFTAVLCWIIFSIPIDIFTVVAIAIVSYATYLYSLNPVSNKGKGKEDRARSDSETNEKKLVPNDSTV